MTAPSEITGPNDLADTVRNAVDPLDEHSYYGTASHPPGHEGARTAEMEKLIADRNLTSRNFYSACTDYVSEHPVRCIAVAATTGAAFAALAFLAADHFLADR